MASMLDELLDLARLRMGQPLELHRRSTDLVALACDVAAELQPSTEFHQVRVETELDQLVGEWDPSRLGRVLVNLVENAIKYSPSGGDVIVSVGRTDRDTGDWATIAVSDQGIGIPEADLERVFERFQRGSNAVGRVLGTGIGLAGVRDIVELHGGAITLASREGVGTTVSVRLPLVAPDGSRARA
jgi:signal transduction histidine kinase